MAVQRYRHIWMLSTHQGSSYIFFVPHKVNKSWSTFWTFKHDHHGPVMPDTANPRFLLHTRQALWHASATLHCGKAQQFTAPPWLGSEPAKA